MTAHSKHRSGPANDVEATVGPESHVKAYCSCFNTGRYFEAHDVLEVWWLPNRRSIDGDFWKGLIQLAGAFVHVQKQRRGPALALLRLARRNLERYRQDRRWVDVRAALGLAAVWEARLVLAGYDVTGGLEGDPPQLAEGGVGPGLQAVWV
jgi:hypothetical protein